MSFAVPYRCRSTCAGQHRVSVTRTVLGRNSRPACTDIKFVLADFLHARHPSAIRLGKTDIVRLYDTWESEG